MTFPYIASSTLWHQEGPEAAYKVLDDFLGEKLQTSDVFSINPERFFGFRDSTHLNFVYRLLQNDSRRAAYCNVFSALWDAHPIQELLILLITKDFTQPGMVKLFGMEDMGFVDPDEDFGVVLEVLRRSVRSGFLSGRSSVGAFDGRAHLHLETVEGIIPEGKWGPKLQLLKSLQAEFDAVGEVPWSAMTPGNEAFILGNFMFEFLSNSKRFSQEAFQNLSNSFEVHVDYHQALTRSVEFIIKADSGTQQGFVMDLFSSNMEAVERNAYFERLYAFLKSPKSASFEQLSLSR